MMYRYLINGTALSDEPRGINELPIDINRDVVNRRVITRFQGSLTFTGDGYDTLKTELDTNGYCSNLPFEIQRREDLSDSWELEQKGTIFLRDCEFDLFREQVSVEIQDESYDARIHNNQGIESRLDTGKSKNGLSFTAPTTQAITFFNPQNGTDNDSFVNSGDRYLVEIDDAFAHLVAFMTDDEVDFASDWYDNRETGLELGILNGLELRTGGEISAVTTSFEFLFQNIAKLYNLYLIMDYSGSKPTLRLEDENYFYDDTITIEIENVREIIQSVNEEFLYSKVQVGSGNVSDTGSRINVRLITPEQENYQIQGQCNAQNVFNLYHEVITDSNVIEDLLLNNSDGFDDSVFLISYDKANTEANQFDPLGLGDTLYNAEMFNSAVIERYNLGGDVAKYFGEGTDDFFARRETTSTDPLTIEPYPFPTEDSDPGNNYDNSTYRYTAPVEGLYSFRAKFHFTNVSGIEDPSLPDGGNLIISIRQYDSTNNLKFRAPAGSRFVRVCYFNSNNDLQYCVDHFNQDPNNIALSGFNSEGEGYVTVDFFTLHMEATDYAQVRLSANFPVGTFTIGDDDSFECYNFQNGSSVFVANESSLYRSSKIELEVPLTQSQIDSIKNNPNKAFRIEGNRNSYIAWHSSTKINRLNRMAEIEALTNLQNINNAN